MDTNLPDCAEDAISNGLKRAEPLYDRAEESIASSWIQQGVPEAEARELARLASGRPQPAAQIGNAELAQQRAELDRAFGITPTKDAA